jgi:hypothetical protein
MKHFFIQIEHYNPITNDERLITINQDCAGYAEALEIVWAEIKRLEEFVVNKIKIELEYET